jgi:probable rRNA maturation factor
MKLSIIDSLEKLDKKFLEKVAKAAFSSLENKKGEIELKFVSEEEIQDLNLTYRNNDKPTDVLSFQVSEMPLIGQVFICYNIAKNQAEELGKPAKDEVALLLVHGILHVFDYDHESNEDADKMQNIETEILAKVGVKR